MRRCYLSREGGGGGGRRRGEGGRRGGGEEEEEEGREEEEKRKYNRLFCTAFRGQAALNSYMTLSRVNILRKCVCVCVCAQGVQYLFSQ